MAMLWQLKLYCCEPMYKKLCNYTTAHACVFVCECGLWNDAENYTYAPLQPRLITSVRQVGCINLHKISKNKKNKKSKIIYVGRKKNAGFMYSALCGCILTPSFGYAIFFFFNSFFRFFFFFATCHIFNYSKMLSSTFYYYFRLRCIGVGVHFRRQSVCIISQHFPAIFVITFFGGIFRCLRFWLWFSPGFGWFGSFSSLLLLMHRRLWQRWRLPLEPQSTSPRLLSKAWPSVC